MTNEACRKISRGQVWFLVDNDLPAVHYKDSVQGKNRPWLVVSNNKCNQSSTIYTVVPLTSQPKNDQPTHVTFSTGEKTQTILCEQIRTIPERVFFNSGSNYRFNMSEKYMALVDEALAIQLGLSLVFPKSEQFWESLERLIRAKVKQAIADSKVEAIDVSKVITLLNGTIDDSIKQETTPVVEPVIETQPETVEEPVPVKTAQKRRSWTKEEKQEFLEYYEKHGGKETAAHYNMKIGSVHTNRFNFFKQLNGGKK